MKIKRKALSLLSCLALLVSSIPSTAVFVSADVNGTNPGTPEYVTGIGGKTNAVFANGTDIEVTYDANSGKNIVTYEGGSIPDVETNASVFAGCHNNDQAVGSDEDPVEIVINGAHLNTVYGGGLHKSTVNNVKITVKDAQLNWVCGGGANCLVEDSCSKGTDYWQTNDAENSKTVVEKAEINIESGSVAQDVYGGGEGFSKTNNTTVNIKGGTINSVCAGGSNGATGNSEVNIENGNITYLYSVNRGTMESSAVTVTGGEIENLYVGAADYPNITGNVSAASVNVEGGKVTNLKPGNSGGQGHQIDVSDSGNFSLELSSEAEVGLDETLQDSEILTCAHNLELQPGTPAQCEATGTADSWKCKNCQKLFRDAEGEEEIEVADTIAVLGHKYSEPIQIVGCDDTTVKFTYAVCLRCGSYFDASSGVEAQYSKLTEANDQNSDQKFDEKDLATYGTHKNLTPNPGYDATCAKEGKTDGYTCDECGKTVVPQLKLDINPDNHKDAQGSETWGEWKAIDENSNKNGEYTPVTCTVDGWQYRECSQCGAEEYKEVKAPGHKWADDIEANRKNWTNKTCTTDGSYQLECTVCHTLSEPKTELHEGHKLEKQKVEAPTCTTDGKIQHWKCSVCGALFLDSEGEQPTDEEGIKDSALGHKETTSYEAIAPTCRATGRNAYVYCKVCDKVISINGVELETPATYEEVKDQIIVPSDENAHVYDKLIGEAQEPNCTDDGAYAYFKCEVCENYYKIIDEKAKTYEKIEVEEGSEPTAEDVKIAALGHDYGDWKPIDEDSDEYQSKTPASCTETGWEYQECKRCDHEEYRQVQATGHKYGDLIPQKDATCTEDGLAAHYKCSVCGKYFDADETEVEYDDLVIPATGHKNIEFVESKDATCLTTGNKEHYKCSDCGQLFLETGTEEDYDATYEQPENILPDTGSYKNTTVKNSAKLEFIPNVSTVISKLAGATVINVTFTVTGVPAGGAKAYLPTVITGGSANWNPSDVCPLIDIPTDGTYTVSYNGPAVPADATFKYMGINIKKASSTSADQSVTSITLVSVTSSLTKTLYLNEATDADIVTPIKSHLDTEYNAKVATAYDDVAATCTDSGWSGGKYCSVCGKVLEARTFVPAKGHNYNQGEVTKEATCTSDGLKTFTCQNANCGSKYTEVIPATGHKYGEEGTVTKAATCTADGIKTFTCETCNNTYTEVIPATGHTEETITGKAATCSEYGLTDGTKCSVCNVILVPQTVLPKTAHTIVTDASVDATCTKTGLTEGTHCSVCNAVITAQAVVPKKPHTPVDDEAVAAKCTQSGKTKGSHCEVCGGIIEEQVVIPALGHEYVNGVCAVCNEKQPNYEPPTQPTQPTQPTTAAPKVSVKVIKITQAKITNLKVKSKAKNKINVSWKKVANAKGYQIEVSKSSSFKPGAKVLTKTTKKLKLTIKNKKLKSKKTYYVRARAYTTYKAADGSTKTAYSNWNYVLRKVKIK